MVIESPILGYFILLITTSFFFLIISEKNVGVRNKAIGYRTKASLKSNSNWKLANTYFAILYKRLYIILWTSQIVLFFITKYSLPLGFLTLIVGFFICFILVELKLAKNQ